MSLPLALALGAAALFLGSALPGALARSAAAGQRVACGLAVLGGAAAIAAGAAALALGASGAAWSGPWLWQGLVVRLDAVGAFFLFPIGAIGALGAVYGLRYWTPAEVGTKAARLQAAWGLCCAGMALLVVAAHALLFLAAWEVMALSGFLLVFTEHEKKDVQRAALLYLAATHTGTLLLFAAFSLAGRDAGGLAFSDLARLDASAPHARAAFALALCGFGFKAGLIPLHFWLPDAHAATPSHVSALMSGVLIKMGIYGLVRFSGFFGAPPASWGFEVLALGVVSALLGVVLALAQHDLKRLLAYHSVENVGIIVMGLGLALLGRSRGDAALVALGLAGAVLHVLNHAIFKSLLFFGAGAVHHATGTREIDRLGGLARAMPVTALAFLVGAVAISGLPPLNGFASEWLVYMGFTRSMARPATGTATLAIFGAAALAMVGGLAAACFAKVFGTVFLGQARSEEARHAHEAPRAMLAPMLALAGLCAAIGLFSFALLPALGDAAAAWSGLDRAATAAALAPALRGAAYVAAMGALVLALAGAVALWRRTRLARATRAAAVTWDCGYAAPTARMQYTGSSFAQLLLATFPLPLGVHAQEAPEPLFPAHAAFHSELPDAAIRLGVEPLVRAVNAIAAAARRFHTPRLHANVVLVVVTLLAFLAWRFIR